MPKIRNPTPEMKMKPEMKIKPEMKMSPEVKTTQNKYSSRLVALCTKQFWFSVLTENYQLGICQQDNCNLGTRYISTKQLSPRDLSLYTWARKIIINWKKHFMNTLPRHACTKPKLEHMSKFICVLINAHCVPVYAGMFMKFFSR